MKQINSETIMNKSDWLIYLKEWSNSVELGLAGQSSPQKSKNSKKNTEVSKANSVDKDTPLIANNKFKILYEINETNKAICYVTDRSESGNLTAIWVPKSAILLVDFENSALYVSKWAKITPISYT